MDHELKNVWDPYLRIFHWALVISFFVAYLTEFDVLTLHYAAGYVVCGLLVFRVYWGLYGPQHAKFSDFIYSPKTVLMYLRALARRDAKRYRGHNPAGGAMVLAYLIMLALICISGLVLYGLEGEAGPFAFLYGMFPSRVDDWFEEIHTFLSNVVIVMIVLHVAGILWSCFLHRENLIKSMINGKKRM